MTSQEHRQKQKSNPKTKGKKPPKSDSNATKIPTGSLTFKEAIIKPSLRKCVNTETHEWIKCTKKKVGNPTKFNKMWRDLRKNKKESQKTQNYYHILKENTMMNQEYDDHEDFYENPADDVSMEEPDPEDMSVDEAELEAEKIDNMT